MAALGDGGALMGDQRAGDRGAARAAAGRGVYNDSGYGAEVHHFGPDGFELGTVRFPDTDLAAIGRGFGCDRR